LYLGLDDAGSPGTSSNMMLTKVTNESTLALSLVNGLTNYGAGSTTNGTDGPGGVALSYKESSVFGMGGCLYMFEQRNHYGNPQNVYFGNVIADNCNHGATWSNHQAPTAFSANGSPDGPGVSMFPDTTNVAWCSFVRYAGDDGTNGYLTAGNEIDGANAYVYANCTDGQWQNASNLWLIRTPRATLGSLTAGNVWQYWAGPTAPTPADFVNPSNWSYASAKKVAIYSAADQTGASDEVFVPGFNYYVLETWYYPSLGTTNNTTWKFLAGPTPAGPFTSFYTSSFSPQGWYNPSFLHRAIASNSSSTSLTANVVFSGDPGNPSSYYHPSYATMTMASNSQTAGVIVTPIADLSGQYVGIVDGAFAYSGHLTSFSIQNFSSYTGTVSVGFCTISGGNFTINNYVNVTSAAGTGVQTFNAPGDFTAPAGTAGQYLCYYQAAGNGVGKYITGGPGFYYSSTSYSSIPVGAHPVAAELVAPNGIDLTGTISIP
jgi:hypothetical protein